MALQLSTVSNYFGMVDMLFDSKVCQTRKDNIPKCDTIGKIIKIYLRLVCSFHYSVEGKISAQLNFLYCHIERYGLFCVKTNLI